MKLSCVLGTGIAIFASVSFAAQRGLVQSKTGKNKALVVGVGHGLPGIDLDENNVTAMAENGEYKFEVTHLHNEEGTVQAIADALTEGSKAADKDGTYMFYFTG